MKMDICKDVFSNTPFHFLSINIVIAAQIYWVQPYKEFGFVQGTWFPFTREWNHSNDY